MELAKIIIQFMIFFLLVDIVSKKYVTLFLLFFIDAYFFNLVGRVMDGVYKLTDISYVTQSLAQPFFKLYEGMTGNEVVLTNQQLLMMFFIVWGIIIMLTVINRGVDNRYLERFHVKEIVKKMREESINAKITLDLVNKRMKSYQYIFIDSIDYLHVFSYQYHVSKYRTIHQRIKLDTIKKLEFKEVENGYQMEIHLSDHRILDGGIYKEKYLPNLKELNQAMKRIQKEPKKELVMIDKEA